jgi:hypothetical protein
LTSYNRSSRSEKLDYDLGLAERRHCPHLPILSHTSLGNHICLAQVKSLRFILSPDRMCSAAEIACQLKTDPHRLTGSDFNTFLTFNRPEDEPSLRPPPEPQELVYRELQLVRTKGRPLQSDGTTRKRAFRLGIEAVDI